MERFENAIFKQHEEINGRMTKMFRLLKELTTSRTLEKVLIREEAKFPVTKNVNSISLTKGEEERSNKTKNEEAVEASGYQPVAYYLKHKINEKLVEGLVNNNNRFNNSLSGTQVGRKKGKAYKVLFGGPIYDAILKKKITKKEDIKGNFKIPYNIGDLKHVNTLIDQGSDVNVMPYSTYMKLTDERPAETDIRLSLASHSYIYPLGIAEDVLVEASIKFDKGTITLRSGKSKVSFHRIPDSSSVTNKGVKNNIEPIAPTMTVNRLILKWEEKIKLHLEMEIKFNQCRSKNFKGKRPTLIATKEEMNDEGEVIFDEKKLGMNESDEPDDDKRDSRLGNSDGIKKSLDCADVSTDTLPINSEESEAGDFLDFSHLFDSNQDNNPEGSFLRRSSRQHKILARLKGSIVWNCYQNMKIVGKLIYLPLIRPDIVYAVHCLCQFMHAPCQSHLKLAFHVLRYLNSSLGTGVCFKHETNLNLYAYVDSDWAKCKVTRKSVT
ncbi:hypothetical protein Tco_1246301 [Tanacetum coccineum]